MNWNKNHNIILPDIADFPDCHKFKKVERTKAIKKSVKESQRSLDKGDYDRFSKSLTALIEESDRQSPLPEKLKSIRAKQFTRIREMGRQHIQDEKRKLSVSRSDLPDSEAYRALEHDGVYQTSIDSKKIELLLAEKIKTLMLKTPDEMERGYDRSITLSRDDAEVFNEINHRYKAAGLLDAVSKYHHSGDLKVKSICLHVAAPEDTHYNQTLKDSSHNTKLVGLHFDPKYVMKSLLYLNDVDEGSGPFTFLPGSHRWWFPSASKVFAKGMSVGNYLNSEGHRQVAMQLPQGLRTNSIVGRLIPDGTPLSDRLLANEILYTGARGTALLFDPSTGFHRGGLCKSKRRINLQIVFG